ncbi:hypothetical protein GQX73_g9258 [Xylaria multiplex]|uniref:Uncharacterized protein n=1 Tax=Xylaria multiplex TaxID=323545 RepID=A0A7C8MZ31_9PEZI|nr:hypothetical protein GQX73_g9258 [Xylaria multiplex]
MAAPRDLDLPIALRRTPRRCVNAVVAQSTRPRVVSAPLATALKTPSKPRSKKRVRFSDPGPELSHYDTADSSFSTGLTPIIKRSSLLEPAPKRRRRSTPEKDTTQKRNAKTRKRMENDAMAAKVEAEVQRLRAELANRDAEIERLHNETLVHDTGRIMELEQQVEALRTELAQQQLPRLTIEDEDDDGNASDGDDGYNLPTHSFYDWTLAPRDPFSDSCLGEVDDFTAMEVACSTPSRRRKSPDVVASKSASASFPTPPCTSPTIPATPCSVRRAMTPVTPHSHMGIQASLPDPEKEALEAELVSLRLELTKLTTTLETHTALQARLSEKLFTAPCTANGSGGSQPELEEHVNSVLQALSERTAALSELNSSLSSLGFAGSNAGEIIASIASGFRQARLELEYITPGEITLPLSSHAAQVLDLVVTRLRDLARKVTEDEDAIDEYHALELSLRQQLSTRVDVMKGMREEHMKNETALRERDDRIAELEVGLDRLKGAAEGYRRDIGELESLVQRLESDGKATEARLQSNLNSTEAQLRERVAVISDLETKLANTVKQAEELETKLKDMQRQKNAEAKVRNKSYGAALALRDARVLELRREIYGINESLRSAHGIIMKLRLENTGLERRAEEAEEGRRLAREAVDTMKAELEKVTAAAAAATPAPRKRTRASAAAEKGLMTPDPQPGSFLSGNLARSGAGRDKKRRKYDSGLGLLDEDGDIELVL